MLSITREVMAVATRHTQPVGQLLRQWREERRLSQLELSSRSGVSTRHLSFVETGRSQPSREMVLRLADQLDVPLRDRNQLLLTAGYAPVYAQTPLESPHMSPVRAAIAQVLAGHEPYPAVVVDREWNLVDANSAAALFMTGIAAHLLEPPSNVLRASLHPDGLAPRIVNLGEWRAHLLARLRRQTSLAAGETLAQLYDELSAYPCDQPEPHVELPGPGDIVVPLRVRHEGQELTFFSVLTTFGTPLDITVAELAIESFFPADEMTAAALRGNAG
jgi:transcriptional regulator with XRE-family HTH domain